MRRGMRERGRAQAEYWLGYFLAARFPACQTGPSTLSLGVPEGAK